MTSDGLGRRIPEDRLRILLEKGLASLGKTMLLTTHYMDEAQYLADRVAVITAGRIVATGAPSTLGGRAPRHRVQLAGRPRGGGLGHRGNADRDAVL